MVRSIFLRGFDQQCANIIGNHLEKSAGAKMKRPFVPVSIEKGADGKLTGSSVNAISVFFRWQLF